MMKKVMTVVLLMVMAVFTSSSFAGLMLTTDGNTLGVDASAGTILATGRLVTDLELDWSGVIWNTIGYPHDPIIIPFSSAPGIIDPEENTFTFFTGTIATPTEEFTIFTGLALPDGWYLVDSAAEAKAEISLVVDVYETAAGPEHDIAFGSVYAAPEPMTMALLGLGGLAVARRRR